jgi:hypothetical protein
VAAMQENEILESAVDALRHPTAGELETLRAECLRISALEPKADRHNIWLTLMALRETPIERLRRSLMRGRGLRSNRL